MIRFAPLAAAAIMAATTPSQASLFSEACKILSRTAYQGAIEGQQMSPIMEGIAVQIHDANTSNADAKRVVTSAYLIGYALGLVGGDPAEAAVEYYNGCMSEDA